jgi:glycerophosphoryl diester phosphodiesterase
MQSSHWLTARPIAHRGYHDRAAGRIENTLAAAEAAVARNFAIECDVQLTADERVVVFHDDLLDRLTEASGPVRGRSLAELKQLRLGDADARIATLEELLDFVGGRVPLVIEMKSAWDGNRRLEAKAAPLIAQYRGPVAVMSFDPDSMRAVRRQTPEVPRGLIADRFNQAPEGSLLSPLRRFALRNLLAAADVRPEFISYGIEALPAVAPALLRRLFGVTVITWTVRTAAERATAALYADQITFEGFDPDAST